MTHNPRPGTGSTFKRCACTNPATRQRLGANCPKLRRRGGAWSADHGTWFLQAELPRHHNGRRRPLRRGGYTNQTHAQEQLDAILALLEVGERRGATALAVIADLIEHRLEVNEPLPTPDQLAQQLDAGNNIGTVPTVEQWLHTWLAGRKKIRGNTVRSYESHIRLWLVPKLGHYRLDVLNTEHIAAMFDDMAIRNDEILAARASNDPDTRASVRGLRIMSAATMQRYRATLRAALNAAIRSPRLPITFNPASYVELASGKRPKALLWTPQRVLHWQHTGQKPSRVMVWTPDQVGQFLDHAEGHPYYLLLHLIAYRGLRRGEACALPWHDTDFTNQTITITSALVQLGWAAEFGEPKSEASGRTIALDNATTELLRTHHQHQTTQRTTIGPRWNEHGLVCTEPDGNPVHPAKLTDAFYALTATAGLPPIRLHDLRHAAATLTLATGADLKTVQELLGHSSITITADTYTHVLPELARDTAEATAAIVPRHRTPNQPPPN